MPSFDRTLQQIGSFGRAQIGLCLLMCFTALFTGEQTLSSVFTAAQHSHWCRLHDVGADEMQVLAPRLPDGGVDSCRRFVGDVAFLRNSSDRDDWMQNSTTVQCHDWIFDTTSILSTVTSQYNLVCDAAYVTKLITSIYMSGFLIGCTVSGMISDRIGRKVTIVAAGILQAASGFGAALSPWLLLHIIFRFLTGVFVASCYTTAFVFLMEVAPPKYRMHAGVTIPCWFAAGIVLMSVVAYFVRNHVTLQIIVAAQPLLLITYYWLVPESPRWLLSRGRREEAEQVCKCLATINGKPLPDDFSLADKDEDEDEEEEEEEMGEEKKDQFFSKSEQPDEAEVKENSEKNKNEKSANAIDLVRSPRMRWRALKIFFIWFANSLAYYGVSLNAGELGGNIYINSSISGLIELPAYIACGLCLNRVGRVCAMAAGLFVGGLGCIISAFVSTIWLKVTLAMAGKFGISASFAVVYIYSAEVFPTVIRNVGVGVSSTHARIGGLLAPQVVLLSHLWDPLPFVAIGVISLCAGVSALLLPETLGHELPESLADAENFGDRNKHAPIQTEKEEAEQKA